MMIRTDLPIVNMDTASEADNDPQHWSIDRVVQELCCSSTPMWSTPNNAHLIPERHRLEDTFRQNHIDGENLLTLDIATLKDDLGISSFGQRRAIMRAIEQLRLQSRSYQQMIFSADSIARMQTAAYTTPQITHSRPSYTPQPTAVTGLGLFSAINSRPAQSPSLNSGLDQNRSHLQHSQVFSGETPLDKRRDLPNRVVEATERLTPEVVPTTGRTAPKPGPLDVLQASVDAELSQNCQRIVEEGSPRSSPNKDTRVEVRRKKVAPMLVSASREASGKDSYLSKEPRPLQETFYYRVATDWQDILYAVPDDDDTNFCIESVAYPPGRRMIAAGQMKHFLQRPVQSLPHSRSLAKVPYDSKRSQKPSAHYFTLFPATGGRPRVCRVEDFPALGDKSRGKPKRKGSAFTHQPHFPDDKKSLSINPEPRAENGEVLSDLGDLSYLLAKYPVAETDELLPLYGDSGDEGELDEQTWKEYQDEKAEKENQSTAMSNTEIEATIEETLEEYRQEWRESKLAKVQWKAYRVWKQCAQQKSRQGALKESQSRKDHSMLQLQKMKAALLKDVWHKPADVKHQCQNLELTTLAIEEYNYLVQSLLSNEPPMRPTRGQLQSKPARQHQVVEEGEELIETESDGNGDNWGDFLDDSSDGGSIHHGLDVDDWDPLIPKKEIVSPTITTSETTTTKEQPAVPRNIPAPTTPMVDANEHDADVETESDSDNIKTPASRRKGMGSKFMSPTTTPKRQREKSRRPLSEPHDQDERDHDTLSESDLSDLDRRPRLPKTKYRSQGRSKVSAIDLTLSSPHSDAEKSAKENSSDFNVFTPDLNPDLGTSPSRKSSKPPSSPPETSNLDSSRRSSHTSSGLPQYGNLHGILNTDWASIEEISDGRRALAKAVYSLERADAKRLDKFIHTLPSTVGEKQREILVDGLIGLLPGGEFGQSGKHQSIHLLALLFLVYNHGINLLDDSFVSEQHIQHAFNEMETAYNYFFDLLSHLLQVSFQDQRQTASTQSKQKRKREQDSFASEGFLISDTDLQMTEDTGSDQLAQDISPSHKKRKRAVAESQEAKHQQKSDQQRIEEQERRRRMMEKKFSQIEANGNIVTPVNFIEPIVYLDRHIAGRVKPHQLKGIQFMWREIIEDPKHQGCILAHTMGLGKTMQVISLLVTIARCNQSDDSAMKHYIPAHLQSSKTMILCPASLLDNWYDELVMWSPDQQILGDIYKLDSSDVHAIKDWFRTGGVLLISYDRFRRLVNKSVKDRASGSIPTLDFEKILLQGPALVIADEAHKMKNAKSTLTLTTKRFKTLSRIALTGSPLNNHLEEYHTMVDWIAPGYLGDIVQFRAKYSEPINEGLYADSTSFQKRVSLRKLHVLKRDLDPKINRADISAIEKDMPMKTEYFITIDLTDLQKEAYNIYVNYMIKSDNGAQRKTGQATLWSWLAILQLLCNHPSCCVSKLKERQQKLFEGQVQSTEEGMTENEGESDSVTTPEEALPTDVTIDTKGPMYDAMQGVIEVFNAVYAAKQLDNVELSYRTSLVHDIIKEAVAIGDKTLIFSHSIPTLNYLNGMLKKIGCKYVRLDGNTKIAERQSMTKMFNKADTYQVFLISMRAGGLGMNLQGANRVIIFDFSYNPSWEEQAIGRAYRLGQRRPVYVYRFRAGGSFEGVLFDKAVFKTQMFQRVVDQKNPMRHTSKNVSDWLFPVKETEQHEFDDCIGKDPKVLDCIIKRVSYIQNIELTETFAKEDDEELNEEEVKAAEAEYLDERLRRENPQAWQAKQQQRQATRLQPPTAFQRPLPPGQRLPAHINPSASMRPGVGYSNSQYFPPPFVRSDLNVAPLPPTQPHATPNSTMEDLQRTLDDGVQQLRRASEEPRPRSTGPDQRPS